MKENLLHKGSCSLSIFHSTTNSHCRKQSYVTLDTVQ